MKIFKHLSLFLSVASTLMSCKSVILFSEREYFGKGNVLKLNSDKSYIYYARLENYVIKFNRGIWEQQGKKLILYNGVFSNDALPLTVEEFEPTENEQQVLVVKLCPKKQMDWELNITDVINVEMIVDGKKYSIKNSISVINLRESFHSVYFRAYPKINSLNICEQLNDTLRSKSIKFPEGKKGGSGVLVNLDINPLYFSQVKLTNDTLRIINDRKIRWNKVYLERPQ